MVSPNWSAAGLVQQGRESVSLACDWYKYKPMECLLGLWLVQMQTFICMNGCAVIGEASLLRKDREMVS